VTFVYSLNLAALFSDNTLVEVRSQIIGITSCVCKLSTYRLSLRYPSTCRWNHVLHAVTSRRAVKGWLYSSYEIRDSVLAKCFPQVEDWSVPFPGDKRRNCIL